MLRLTLGFTVGERHYEVDIGPFVGTGRELPPLERAPDMTDDEVLALIRDTFGAENVKDVGPAAPGPRRLG